jgi:predicted AAA+ superfamily ATPase
MLYPRNLKSLLLAAAKDTPVILVNGARQTGKSTLVENLHNLPPAHYISFDDLPNFAAAKSAPQDFIDNLPEKVVLDEIQRVPELFIPIKRSVDLNRKPGRFFLTGSANILTLPRLADSLAGRVEIHTIWPLSQGEIRSVKEGFIDAIFSKNKFQYKSQLKEEELINIILAGGYPESLLRKEASRRNAWFKSYLNTILERDVKELSDIKGLIALPNLLSILTSRIGGLLNFAELSRTAKLPASTLKRYMALLQSVFLVISLPSWHNNFGKRLIKSPKIYLSDTGLACHLLQLSAQALLKNRTLLGPLLENFVLMELMKQCSWSNVQPKLFHFRTESGQEVDFVLETTDRRLVAIEVKASSSVNAATFNSLKLLRNQVKEHFQCGIVLYTGTDAISFGERLFAIPISALWELHTRPASPLT